MPDHFEGRRTEQGVEPGPAPAGAALEVVVGSYPRLVSDDPHAGLQRVGLLATRFTMEEEFYRGRLNDRHGLQVLIPPEEDRQVVHEIIYNELCAGQVKATSRQAYCQIIGRLVDREAQAIILGCTEIGLLVRSQDSPVPLFDTTTLHARAAVDYSLD